MMEPIERKLIAVLCADVKDYSQHMQRDEDGTVRRLNAYRRLFDQAIADHQGRIANTAGDSVVAEFASVREAVTCAVRVQETLWEQNQPLPPGQQLQFRIGINLGDVIRKGQDILGDGVNIAARIESTAEAGGIALSGSVYDSIKNKLPYKYEFQGEQRLKNITEPVRVYKVVLETEMVSKSADQSTETSTLSAPHSSPLAPRPSPHPLRLTLTLIVAVLVVLTAAVLLGIYHLPKRAGAPAVSEKATLPEPAVTPAAAVSPAIAVLPFTNMSADPEQEYFSDGLSEELLNQLAQIQDLRVIARTSSFAFKGQNRDVREIATILNVTHLLEGSVRKAGEKLRITAQLINAADGAHLWSKTYDRALKDIFAIQDEIAREVTGELSLTLGVSFIAPDYGGTKKIEAYEHYLRGVEHIDLRDSRSAADEFKLAIAADPDYGRAWAHLATVLTSRSSDAAGRREHNEAMKRALELVPDLPLTRVAEMQLYVDRREWVRAHEICAIVIAEAHDPTADRSCATFFSGTGRVRTAFPYYEAARQTDPLAITEAVGVSRQYALLDKDEQFIHEYTRSQDLSGNRWEIEAYRYIHLMHRGAHAESIIEQLERYCAIRNDTTSPCHGLLRAHRLPGEAETILREQLDALRTTNPLAGTTIAVTAAYFGYHQLALDAIEAFTLSGAGTSPLQYLWFPILSDVRREPRFKEIVSDIGFVDLWRATGDWGDYCRPVGNEDFECE